MTNRTTGDGNPRYWALKLLLDSLDNDDMITTSDDEDKNKDNNTDRIVYSTVVGEQQQQQHQQQVYIQGRITKQGDRIMILVNKSYLQQTAILPPLPIPPVLSSSSSSSMSDDNNNDNDNDGGYYYHVSVVDESTHDGPWKEFNLSPTTTMLTLKPFAVAIAVVRVLQRDNIKVLQEKET